MWMHYTRIMRAFSIFLFTVGVYLMTMNSWNARYFSLQTAVIAGLSEQETFALRDQVFPGFNLVEGDETFRFGSAVYPMKQPGQAVLGSLVYRPLRALNINFVNHYDYAVHIITLFTSTVMVGTVSALLYLMAKKFTGSEKIATLSAITFSFASIVWPYAGVMHHDIYAMFFEFLAVYIFFRYLDEKQPPTLVFLSGVLAGLTLFFSMLPVTFPIVMLGIILIRKNMREVKNYLFGLVGGLIPSLVFNYLEFGHILNFPNLAGKVSDTFPVFDLNNFGSHLWFYLVSPESSLWAYSPVYLLAIWGILYAGKKQPALKLLMIAVPLAQILHISLQETYGGFQYGPRYLLTILPILALGWPFFLREKQTKFWRLVYFVSLFFSVGTAGLGAVQTVMYEGTPYGPGKFLGNVWRGELPEFRMVGVGILVLIGAYFVSKISLRPRHR